MGIKSKFFDIYLRFGLLSMNKTNLRDVFGDPSRRRCWLLARALESAPLDEALALAKEAEAFLMRSADASEEDLVACHAALVQPSTSLH